MISPRETELLAETRIEEWQRVVLPNAERRYLLEQDFQGLQLAPTRPAWRAGFGWLGARMVAAGERMQALGALAVRPEA